jgi:membrane protein
MRARLTAWTATARAWGEDFTRTRSALAAGGLAYFVALSVGPAALALGALTGLILEPAQIRAAIDRIVDATPVSGAQGDSLVSALVALVESASTTAFTVTTVVGVVVAVYAASKVVLGLRHSVGAAFGVEETRSGIVERALSAVATLVGLVVAVAVVVVMTLLPRLLAWLGLDDVALGTGSGVIDWVLLAVAVYATTWLVLRIAPTGGHRMRVLAPGPAVATLGILVITAGLGVYARASGSLGAAVLVFGTAVVGLLWLYLCFVALLWGATIEAARRRTSAADRPPAP